MRSHKGQTKRKTRSLPWLALQLYTASMRLDHLLDDGQAKPCTAGRTRARGVGTIETLEDVWQVLGSNALAAIFYSHAHLFPISMCIHPDCSPGRRMCNGVAQ